MAIINNINQNTKKSQMDQQFSLYHNHIQSLRWFIMMQQEASEQPRAINNYPLNLENFAIYQEISSESDANLQQEQQQEDSQLESFLFPTPPFQKTRKKRVNIDKAKLQKMAQAFRVYSQRQNQLDCLSLQQIAKRLNLSHTTVSRRYKEFMRSQRVQQNSRIQSSQIISYEKTKQMHEIIDLCLKRKRFTSAPQLAQYISQNYAKSYTRFQVLSYLKKVKKNNSGNQQRKIQSHNNSLSAINKSYQAFARNDNNMFFYSELDYFLSDGIITIHMICGNLGLAFILRGRANEALKSSGDVLFRLLQMYFEQYGCCSNYVLAINIDDYYQLKRQKQRNLAHMEAIIRAVVQQKGKIFIIPQNLKHTNLASYILKKATHSKMAVGELKLELERQKLGFSYQLYQEFAKGGSGSTTSLSRQTAAWVK